MAGNPEKPAKKKKDAEAGEGKLHESNAPVKVPIEKPSFAWEGPPALVVVGGAGLTIGSRLNITASSTVIGRTPDVEFPVLDGSISRRHAELLLAPDGSVLVHDLESRHGTFVNDVRLDGPVPLNDGDYLRCGNVVWKFRTAKADTKRNAKP